MQNKVIKHMLKLKRLFDMVLIVFSCYGCHDSLTNKPASNSFAASVSAKTKSDSSKRKPACCKGAPSRIKALSANQKTVSSNTN